MAVLAIPALGFINPGMTEGKKGTGNFYPFLQRVKGLIFR